MEDQQQSDIASASKNRKAIRVNKKTDLTKLIVIALRCLSDDTNRSSASLSSIEAYINAHYFLEHSDTIMAKQLKLSARHAIRRGILRKTNQQEYSLVLRAASKEDATENTSTLDSTICNVSAEYSIGKQAGLSPPESPSCIAHDASSRTSEQPLYSDALNVDSSLCEAHKAPELASKCKATAGSDIETPSASKRPGSFRCSNIIYTGISLVHQSAGHKQQCMDPLCSQPPVADHGTEDLVDGALSQCRGVQVKVKTEESTKAGQSARLTLRPRRNYSQRNARRTARPIPLCSFCSGSVAENRDGVPEILLCCVECGYSGHPTCLKFEQELVEHIKTLRWQCIECKRCYECEQTGAHDDSLLFCDGCDRGFHLDCLQPSLTCAPHGDWRCAFCNGSRTDRPKDLLYPGELCHIPLEVLDKPRADRPSKSKGGIELSTVQPTQSTPRPRGRPRKLTPITKTDADHVQPCQPPAESRPSKSTNQLNVSTPRARRNKRKIEKEKPIAPHVESNKKAKIKATSTITPAPKLNVPSNITQDDIDMFRRAHEAAAKSISLSTGFCLNNSSEPPRRASPKSKRRRSNNRVVSSLVTPAAAAASRHPPVITIGKYQIATWYSAPYPHEYARLKELFVCQFCLLYFKSVQSLARHIEKCTPCHPPADEIYRSSCPSTSAIGPATCESNSIPSENGQHTQAQLSVWEVDGQTQKLYCQNLCLLAKAFLDHKTLYYDVEPFLFYVLTMRDSPDDAHQLVGYFSKEKHCPNKYNVSCITVLPPFQRLGLGRFLIEFSYLLSRCEYQPGTPEKPLSDLGRISYHAYWKSVLIEHVYTRLCEKRAKVGNGNSGASAQQLVDMSTVKLSLAELSTQTGIRAHDLVETMFVLGMLMPSDIIDQLSLRVSIDDLEQYINTNTKKRAARIPIDPSALRWTPYVGREARESDEDEGETTATTRTDGQVKLDLNSTSTAVDTAMVKVNVKQAAVKRRSVKKQGSAARPETSARVVATEQPSTSKRRDAIAKPVSANAPERRRTRQLTKEMTTTTIMQEVNQVLPEQQHLVRLASKSASALSDCNCVESESDLHINQATKADPDRDSNCAQSITENAALDEEKLSTCDLPARNEEQHYTKESDEVVMRKISASSNHASVQQLQTTVDEVVKELIHDDNNIDKQKMIQDDEVALVEQPSANSPFASIEKQEVVPDDEVALVQQPSANSPCTSQRSNEKSDSISQSGLASLPSEIGAQYDTVDAALPIDVSQPLTVDVSTLRSTVPNATSAHQSPHMGVPMQMRPVAMYAYSPQTVAGYAPSPHSVPPSATHSPHAFGVQQASVSPHAQLRTAQYGSLSPSPLPSVSQSTTAVANHFVAPPHVMGTAWSHHAASMQQRHPSQPQTVAQNYHVPVQCVSNASDLQQLTGVGLNRNATSYSYMQQTAAPSFNSTTQIGCNPVFQDGSSYYANSNTSPIAFNGVATPMASNSMPRPAPDLDGSAGFYRMNQMTYAARNNSCVHFLGGERYVPTNMTVSTSVDQYTSVNFDSDRNTYAYGMNVDAQKFMRRPSVAPVIPAGNVNRNWTVMGENSLSFTALLMDNGRNAGDSPMNAVNLSDRAPPLASNMMTAPIFDNSAARSGSASGYEYTHSTQMQPVAWPPTAPSATSYPTAASWNGTPYWPSTYRQ